MKCDSCGSDLAARVRYRARAWSCDICDDISAAWMPDVFFDGKPVSSLKDPSGKPITFSCRTEKARYLREKGLVELGDRVGGADYFDGGGERKPTEREKRERVNQTWETWQKAKATLKR